MSAEKWESKSSNRDGTGLSESALTGAQVLAVNRYCAGPG